MTNRLEQYPLSRRPVFATPALDSPITWVDHQSLVSDAYHERQPPYSLPSTFRYQEPKGTRTFTRVHTLRRMRLLVTS